MVFLLEIELPDGTILEAPDGSDTRKVVQGFRLRQRMASNPGEYDPNSAEFKAGYGPNSSEESSPLTEGFVSGVTRAMRGLGNLENDLLQMHPLTKTLSLPKKGFWQDEAIKEQDEVDSPLSKTRRGAVGQLLGQTAVTAAATAPIGGFGAVPKGASLLARTLGSAPMRAAVEGGIGGAALASPDEQGEGAAEGAALSAILDRAFAGGGRLIRGLIQKSDAAKELEHLAGQHGQEIFIPISQAADEVDTISRLGKQVFSEALPIIPGVKYRLNKQGRDASELTREMAIKEGLPEGVQLPTNPGRNVEDAVRVVQKGFDDSYAQTIKSYSFGVGQNFKKDLTKAMSLSSGAGTSVNRQTLTDLAGKVDALMQKFSDGSGVIDGTNLMYLRGEINTLIKKAKDYEKAPLEAALRHVDDMVEAQLKQGGKASNIADFEKYSALGPAEKIFRPVKEAAESTPETEGRFLFRTLARKGQGVPEQRAIGQLGAQTLDKPAATGTLTGRILANLGMAGAGVGAFMAPAATATAMVGGQVLTSKTAQRALMGDLKAQKAIASLLEMYPDRADDIERTLRQAAVSGSSGE
jgi:hypothetical protein